MDSKNEKRRKFSLGRFLVLTFACAVFLYSGTQLWSYFAENRENEDKQQELVDQAVVVLKPETVPQEEPQSDMETASAEESTEPTEPVETAPIYVDFAALQAENPDIVGWIYSEGTKINYPILKGPDNQHYLYLMYNGVYNANGSIFMDFRNLDDFTDFNNIVYGHNMPDDMMFGSLKHYREQEYYEEHPVMWILTPEKAFRVDLFAGLVTPSDSDTYEIFSYAEDMHERMEYALSQSTFDAGDVDISSMEHVITLSTCTYDYATARYVVIGNLVEVAYPQPPDTPETTQP